MVLCIMPFDLQRYLLDLLKAPTKRDLQVKIGASNASNPCTRCLGEQLLASKLAMEDADREAGYSHTNRYWLGAVVGTALHERLENRVLELHPEDKPENKVVIGELPHYGTITATTDLYIPGQSMLVDWKTTTRDKLPAIKEALTTVATEYDTTSLTQARTKTQGYIAQLHLYGLGMLNAGFEVASVGIGFVCRDGKVDKDVWAHVLPFDLAYAEGVWARVERLWEWVRDGGDPTTLVSDKGCWPCAMRH